MTRLRSAMHLDTDFTFVDRDCVTIYPEIVDSILVARKREKTTT